MLDHAPQQRGAADPPAGPLLDATPAGRDDDAYESARLTLAAWRADGTLAADPEPALYGYRMACADATGRRHVTAQSA